MIHHIDFAVTDFERSRAFYVDALAPLGIGLVMDIERDNGRRLAGFGLSPDPTFWIRTGNGIGGRLHVAFLANSRGAVDGFHEAALRAGGTDNAGPGCGRGTQRTTTPRSCLIRMATTLKRSAVVRNDTRYVVPAA